MPDHGMYSHVHEETHGVFIMYTEVYVFKLSDLLPNLMHPNPKFE